MRITVNGCYWNTCKLKFTTTSTQVCGLALVSMWIHPKPGHQAYWTKCWFAPKYNINKLASNCQWPSVRSGDLPALALVHPSPDCLFKSYRLKSRTLLPLVVSSVRPLPHPSTQGLEHDTSNCRTTSVEFKFIHNLTSRYRDKAKHMSGENTVPHHSIDKDAVDKAHVCLHLSSLLICQMTAKTVSLKTQQNMNNNI